MKTDKEIIGHLSEVAQMIPEGTIPTFFDEMFEDHIRVTSLTGPPLADQFAVISALKALLMSVTE